jgi:hypothetical protein
MQVKLLVTFRMGKKGVATKSRKRKRDGKEVELPPSKVGKVDDPFFLSHLILERNRMYLICASGSSSHTYDRQYSVHPNNIITKESIKILYYMTESLNLKRMNKRL